MISNEAGWIKVAQSVQEIQFQSNNIAEVVVAEKVICIAKWNHDYFAFAQKCPHASGLFINGFIDVLGNVVCPLHHFKFCLKNGRNVSGEGYQLKCWQVHVSAEGVFIRF